MKRSIESNDLPTLRSHAILQIRKDLLKPFLIIRKESRESFPKKRQAMNEKQILQLILGEFSDKIDLLKEITHRDIQFPEAPSKIKSGYRHASHGKDLSDLSKNLSYDPKRSACRLNFVYVEHIEDAYLAFAVSLYDKSMRKIQSNPKKIYAIDPGIIRSVTMDYENDLGRLFENIIYIELRRLDCHVDYYLTRNRHEVDFIVTTARGYRKLFQVAWDIEDPKTLEREQRALQEAIQELSIDGELITLKLLSSAWN